MADKKISQLPLIQTISGSTVVVPIVHDGTTIQMSVERLSLFTSQFSAITGSNTFIGNQTVNGNVTVTGTLTAQEYYSEITSASIIYSEGSTIFGNTADDTHTFIGTINVNGKVVGNAPLDFTSQSLNTQTGSQESTNLRISSVTGSMNTQSSSQDSVNFINSTVTSSLNVSTASLNFTTGALNIASGSYNRLYQVTSSVHSTTASLNQATSSLNFASGALEIATGSYNRFYQATASIHSTTSSLNQATSSLNFASGALEIATGSYNRFYDMTSSVHFTTQSLNVQTGSQQNLNAQIGIATASLNFATQSLNIQTGSQGNLNAQIGIATASLNFTTGALNAFTGSVIGQTNTISTFTASVNFTTQSLNTQTGSQQSMNTTLSIVTGSMRAEIGGIEAYTASLKSAIVVNGTSVRIVGELTASRIYTEFITSSVLFVTGSNIIGDQSSDKHEFTGSVNINDTLFIKGQAIGLGELNAFTGSQIGKDGTLAIVTSSLRAEIGGIEAYTASLKAATIVSSSTQIFTGYDYEIHVSQVDGNDTTGNGDLLTPVATITKALQIVSSSYLSTDRRTVIIHPGTYTESPTVTLANTYIFALGLLGANTVIAGTLTINAACRVSGIKMTNLVVNTTSAVYINNTTVDTQMTVTNTGYLETTGCSFQCPSGVTVSGAAPGVVFNSTTLWGLVVSNASAIVIVRNSPQVLVATVTAGNLALSNTLLFSATPTGNAITTSAGTVVTLSNLNILDNTGLAVARVSLSGFYSIIDVVYDKPNSTLVALSGTGGPLNAIDYFQYINADKFVTQGGTGYQFLKGDGSLDSTMPSSLQQTTASLNTQTGSQQNLNAQIGIATGSLNSTTGSLIGITNGLMALTASMKNSTIISSSNQIPELFTLMQVTASLNSKTGSYATTGSNIFIGNQTITGSLSVSGSIFISGSVYANTTSQSVASNTASLDFTAANFFMVQLGSSVTTHISASNLRAGQSVNVLVTTGTNSTASFSTNVRQPSGSFYLPTSGSGKKDILSFVSFDSTNLYLVAINQMI
jgi:hypothetical protein